MDPITGLITGGASLLGGFFNNQQSAANTQAQIQAQQQMLSQTEQFNAQQAEQQMQFQGQSQQAAMSFGAQQTQQQEAFQQQMSSTAYQRAAADMKAAGLNPMMMFGSGSAASTPSGASAGVGSLSGSAASVGTPNVPLSQRQGALANLGQAVSTAVDAMVKQKYTDKMSAEIANLGVEQTRTKAQADLLKQQYDINKPAAIQSGIRSEYPSLLQNILTYGGDIAGGVSKVGKAVWDVLPTGRLPVFRGSSGNFVRPAGSNAVNNLVGSTAKDAGNVGTSSDSGVMSAGTAKRMEDAARQSETFREWNKKLDAVREQFERDNPGFVGEGR